MDEKRGRFVVTVLALSAFGPYLAGGLRTDQLAAYGFATLLLPLLWPQIRVGIAGAVMLGSLLTFLAISALVWATGGSAAATDWGPGSALANADNLLLPLTAFLVVVAVVRPEGRERGLVITTRIVTAAMCANAVVAIMQYLFPSMTNPVIASFWGAGGTAERALTIGRYTGIVGQPSAAGIMYSLALVCAIYVLRDRGKIQACVIGLLVLGGVMTLSKGFLLGGLPIAAWQLLTVGGKFGRRATVVLLAAALTSAVAAVGLLDRWQGLDRLLYLLPGGEANLNDYLGNRYGDSGTAGMLLDAVWEQEPIHGYGLSGLRIATDTAFAHGMVLGGLLGVLAVTVMTLTPLVTVFRRRLSLPRHELFLFSGVSLIVAVTSLGAPTLVVNRVSVVVWMLFALLLSGPRDRLLREPGQFQSERTRNEESETSAMPRVALGPGSQERVGTTPHRRALDSSD